MAFWFLMSMNLDSFLSRVSLERSPNCNIELLIVIPAAAIVLKNLYDHTHNYICVQAMETSVIYV